MSYLKDLAYIHDRGFAEFANRATPAIIGILQARGITEGHVLDLGCGSGISSRLLLDAGYTVTGIDSSPEMIKLARQRAPEAEFITASIYQVKLPQCDVALAIGECFNYLFDPEAEEKLPAFLQRVFNNLPPRGMLICDVAEPGQVRPGDNGKSFLEGDDWAILMQKREDKDNQILERDMSLYRQVDGHFRRSRETHRVKLYRSSQMSELLRAQGFRAQIRRKYGDYPLRQNVAAFFATRP